MKGKSDKNSRFFMPKIEEISAILTFEKFLSFIYKLLVFPFVYIVKTLLGGCANGNRKKR